MAWRARALIDLLSTLPGAYWEERHSFRPARPARWAGGVTFLLVYLGVITVTSLQPRIYLASSRLQIPSAPAAIPLWEQPDLAAVDPFQLQVESERILAHDALLAVGRDLNLPVRLAGQNRADTPLDPSLAAEILRRHLEVRRIRLTRLVEIRSYFQDAALGAEVANRVAEEYRRRRATTSPDHPVRIVDLAEPGLRPVAPNVPLNLAIGLLPAVGLGLLLTLALGLAAGWRRGSPVT